MFAIDGTSVASRGTSGSTLSLSEGNETSVSYTFCRTSPPADSLSIAGSSESGSRAVAAAKMAGYFSCAVGAPGSTRTVYPADLVSAPVDTTPQFPASRDSFDVRPKSRSTVLASLRAKLI